MTTTITTKTNFSLGHAIIEAKGRGCRHARLLLEETGLLGLKSLLGALISNGEHLSGHLLSEVAEIAGETDFRVGDVLKHEEGTLWFEEEGSYYLLHREEAASECGCRDEHYQTSTISAEPSGGGRSGRPDTSVGFSLLRGAQDLKLQFHEAGYEGRVSFVKACINFGMVWDHTIVQAAVAIAGRHLEDELSFLIEEGENEHWGRNEDGELYVL